MFVEPELRQDADEVLLSLSRIISKSTQGLIQIGEGLYLCPHFNFNYEMVQGTFRSYHTEKDFYGLNLDEFSDGENFLNEYGVCDSPEQFMQRFGDALGDSPRKFCVSFTEIRKENQDPDGGWRWHKWGPYVGDQTPTCEYLYDEPDIEVVFSYHIYELNAISV